MVHESGAGGGGLFEKFMEIVIIHLPFRLGLTRVTSP